ncbi:C40 family peptidase [Streptomyces formicae]|uniref:C40 family peptidase n=1 Tax=Streptomyces formicae TaxID=1616117 RepID=A0ABY3WIB1_9ACTN|nr:C40 family peptidase [Streptomyces formicae]UNM12331.1 C40 family peptidase [Streptomyces formicae]
MARGEEIVELARQSLGVKYVWGGNSLTSGIDCSGLVQQVFKAYGIALPRVTYDQINVGYSVQPNKLRPGDLVFFDTDRKRSGPDHVGIYIGGGKFIHAPRPGDKVKISSLAEGYYMDRWMGGRRVPGVSASASSGGGEALEVAPKLDAHELAEAYGMSYAFFKSQPELWKMLNKAVEGQWTGQKFQAEVKNSSWWKNHSSSLRQAQVLAKTDPATYKATIEAARVMARQMAVQAGAILSEANVNKLAGNLVHLDWNEAQVANFLGQYVKFGADKTLGGLAGQAANAIKREAYGLGIAISDQAVLNNAQYLVRGLTTMEKISGSLRQQAAGLYPAFAEQIKAGANIQDLAQPYVQVLAQELQLPETDIDAFSPKIKAALNRAGPDGQPSPMNLNDFTQVVRNDPGWRRTPSTAERTMNIGRQVLRDMGLVS